MGASASPLEAWKSAYCKKKGSGISVVRLFTFNMVLWVEGPPFVHSCGIFWTNLCDSGLISMIHST